MRVGDWVEDMVWYAGLFGDWVATATDQLRSRQGKVPYEGSLIR
jgi:hypothetical protein